MKQTTITAEEQKAINLLPTLNLAGVARIVRANWKNVWFGAKPYLQAMGELNSIKDNYYADSGVSVVLYFLSNAQTWKGPIARACKAELNKRAKACY
jgi:hypothetical protein